MSDRWEWIEHLVPFRFFRVLWDSLFPRRFRAIVLDALDGEPAADYARPLTFCLGCWLLMYAAFKSFPGEDVSAGVAQTLTTLPVTERRAVVQALGLDAIAAPPIPDTGRVKFDGDRATAATRILHATLKKPVGRTDGHDIAAYLETHGQADLGLRVRGYLDRALSGGREFTETVVVMFAVFGLLPAWLVSHAILGARQRSFRQTRFVHMYNDSWLLVYFIIPFVLAEYSQQAFDSEWPSRVAILLALAAVPFWLVRTVWLYRSTHGVPVWRIAASHMLGFAVALSAAFGMAFLSGMLSGLLHRAGV